MLDETKVLKYPWWSIYLCIHLSIHLSIVYMTHHVVPRPFFFCSRGRGYLFPARPVDIISRIKGLDEIREWRTVWKVKWRGRRRCYRFYKGCIAWDSVNNNTARPPRGDAAKVVSATVWVQMAGSSSNLELEPFKSTPSLLDFSCLDKPNNLLLAVFPF